jgi:hypothetical protein
VSPAVVTLGVRYMTPVISVCIVARGFTSHQCSALAPGAGTLYCQVMGPVPFATSWHTVLSGWATNSSASVNPVLSPVPSLLLHQFSKRLQGIDLANNKD